MSDDDRKKQKDRAYKCRECNQEKFKMRHENMNKDGTGLCKDCQDKEKKQFKQKSQDCKKWQPKRGAEDPKKKLCDLCYQQSETKLEIKIIKRKKIFKCPIKECEKWKRIDALKDLKGSKMCKVCFNKKSGKNKDNNEKQNLLND